VVQRSRESELDVLRQELSLAWEELEDSELEKKDLELQVAAKGLEAVNWLTEDINVELDRERIVFQGEQNSLLHELERALADKKRLKSRQMRMWNDCRGRSRSSSS